VPQAKLARPKVDRYMRAELRFPAAAPGASPRRCSRRGSLAIQARVEGSAGEMRVLNPLAPAVLPLAQGHPPGRTTRERIKGDATYTHQLRAFAEHVRGGTADVERCARRDRQHARDRRDLSRRGPARARERA
jgi:predicted dehydrogenase